MPPDRSNTRKGVPGAHKNLRGSVAIDTSSDAKDITESYNRLADSVSRLSIEEASAAYGYGPGPKGQHRGHRARDLPSATAPGRYAPSSPSPQALRARYNIGVAPYPNHEEHENYRTSQKYGTKNPQASAMATVTSHVLNKMVSVCDRDTPTMVTARPSLLAIQNLIPMAPFSMSNLIPLFPVNIASIPQTSGLQCQLGDVAARTIRRVILRPATWVPQHKEQGRRRSHANKDVDVLATQLKRTTLAHPKARKALGKRVARAGHDLTGEVRTPSRPLQTVSSPATVTAASVANGPYGNKALSQDEFDASVLPSQSQDHSKDETDAEYAALVAALFDNGEDSDEDDDEDDEYYDPGSSSSSSCSCPYKGKGVDPRERPTPHPSATTQTFLKDAGSYGDEDALMDYCVPAHGRPATLPDFGHKIVAGAVTYLASPWGDRYASSSPAEYTAAEDSWGPSSTSSSEGPDSDYTMEVYSDDEDL